MLRIVPMTNSAEQERICLYCGIRYDKSKFAYGAYEDDHIVGAAQFTVSGGVGHITELKCAGEADYPLMMLIGRAVLNFMDLHEVKEAYFQPRGEVYDKAAALIGFKLVNGSFYARLDGMFTTGHEALPH